MKTFKAMGIGGEEVPDLLIEATEPIKEAGVTDFDSGEWLNKLEREADAIVDALHASLPGGVLDRIYAKMTQRRASMLAVTWDSLHMMGGKI